MKLSISNIAWNPSQDSSVAKLLQHHFVYGIDIAPGKYFPNPATARSEEVNYVKYWWKDHGIDIIGMQALMFGTSSMNLFGDSAIRQLMLNHLRALCTIAGRLGVQYLVFGSPKNRDRSGLSDARTLDMARIFFSELGVIAYDCGVVICLEPNPIRYGSNFMLNCSDTAEIVSLVDHPAVKMQLDTGSLAINSENISLVLHKYAPLIGHIHASEPDLIPLGGGAVDHAMFAECIVKKFPDRWITIEMLTSSPALTLEEVGSSIEMASRFYGPDAMVAVP
jgi:sugar phosphate isomerase/epimerase